MNLPSRTERIREAMKSQPARAAATPAPRAPTPQRTPEAVEVYYDSGKKSFWGQNTQREWIELNESSLRRILKARGYSSNLPDGAALSPLDQQIMRLQLDHGVHFAGEIAGYAAGPRQINGSRVLVVRGAAPISPAKGSCETVKDFLGQLLGEQLVYVLGWLRSAVAALRAGPDWRPGQMLALAGPAGCGKSLFQALVTELLGGRVAKPYRYLIGDTAFNSELFEAEHLAIEDEAASTDMRTRRHFGAQLKNLIVNTVQSYHAKGRAALSLTPFWRVTITLNDEPENLLVLPPLDESLRDKIILLRAFRVAFPYHPDDLAGRKHFRAQLSKELPAFLAWLREWRIPERLKDQRYGVKAWQNPELVEALQELSAEDRLLNLIDTAERDGKLLTPWEGTAMQLETALTKHFAPGLIGSLFSFTGACGTYLGRLKARFPDRFSRSRGPNNVHLWRIEPFDISHGKHGEK